MTSGLNIDVYASLIEQFISGAITSYEFEDRYLRLFKEDSRSFSGAEYDILNRLFTDLDAYCPHPGLRGEDDISDEQLVASARSALRQLRAYAWD
ncbi:colicin immunity domain-containing protein [Marinobacter sp. OP 3.4]|uniref:colicin immunity domain-containing protein n=1 Tax=Marinobacter sp. OP 3.4 TaxID=3076501 RepID=UPI002E1E5345